MRSYGQRPSFAFFTVLCAGSAGLTGCDDVGSFYSMATRSEVFVQKNAVPQTNILLMVDNSKSMAPIRSEMVAASQKFLSELDRLSVADYRLAIGTIDNLNPANTGFVRAADGRKFVERGSRDPVSDFSAIMGAVAHSDYAFWEAGLEESYELLSSAEGSELMERKGRLAVIYATDEESFDCKKTSGTCVGGPPELPDPTHRPGGWVEWAAARYVEYFRSLARATGIDVLLFPIVARPGEESCGTVGAKYLSVLSDFGAGFSGSICKDKVGESFVKIARYLSDLGTRFRLSTPTTASGLSVRVDGRNVPYSDRDGWTFDEAGQAVVFHGYEVPVNGAVIEVTYMTAQ